VVIWFELSRRGWVLEVRKRKGWDGDEREGEMPLSSLNLGVSEPSRSGPAAGTSGREMEDGSRVRWMALCTARSTVPARCNLGSFPAQLSILPSYQWLGISTRSNLALYNLVQQRTNSISHFFKQLPALLFRYGAPLPPSTYLRYNTMAMHLQSSTSERAHADD